MLDRRQQTPADFMPHRQPQPQLLSVSCQHSNQSVKVGLSAVVLRTEGVKDCSGFCITVRLCDTFCLPAVMLTCSTLPSLYSISKSSPRLSRSKAW